VYAVTEAIGQCPHVGLVTTRRWGGGAVATGAAGTVVGGAKAELAPVLEEDDTPLVGDVVEGDSVEGVDTAVGGLNEAADAPESLAWLGVS
jgi:hypothetical protein